MGLGTPVSLTVVSWGGHSRQSLEVVSAGDERTRSGRGVIADFKIEQ